jgi:aspartate/methionine/tyrosine aminotransferase
MSDSDREGDPFLFAHKHWKEIVWMSQNTNQISTSDSIQAAVRRALEEQVYNLYPYSKGLPDLTAAMKRDLGAEDYDCMLTHGGIEALYMITRALLAEGDEVIATDPSFMPIHHQIRLCNANPVEIGIYKEPWKLAIGEIEESISKKTRMILLIDPHNPLGSEYGRDEIKAICDIARDNDLYLVDDITYRDFAFDHHQTRDFYSEKTILVYSFSKNCGMAGLRIGGYLATPELVKAIDRYNTNVLSVNILAQTAALAALETKNDWFGNVVKICRDNQEMIRSAVGKIDGCFLPVYPSSTNMFLIDVSGTGLDPDAIQKKLLYEHKVFVRSGNYVSKKYGGKFIRVSFSVPKEGCERFVNALPVVIDELMG